MNAPSNLQNTLVRNAGVLLGCVALVLLAYWRTLSGGFLSDDVVIGLVIPDGSSVDWRHVARTFAGDWRGFDHAEVRYFRPLIVVSYALDCVVFGLKSWGFHLTNLFVHALNGFLVLHLALRLGASRLAAAFAAGAFLLHPWHSEAVVWVSGRCDLFYAAAALGALIAHLGFRQHGRYRELVVTGLLYVVALLAKDSGIAVPLMIIALDAVRPGYARSEKRARLGCSVARSDPDQRNLPGVAGESAGRHFQRPPSRLHHRVVQRHVGRLGKEFRAVLLAVQPRAGSAGASTVLHRRALGARSGRLRRARSRASRPVARARGAGVLLVLRRLGGSVRSQHGTDVGSARYSAVVPTERVAHDRACAVCGRRSRPGKRPLRGPSPIRSADVACDELAFGCSRGGHDRPPPRRARAQSASLDRSRKNHRRPPGHVREHLRSLRR